MDELVFQRETLRRALMACVEQLEGAAGNYDPEAASPAEDVTAALRLAALGLEVTKYIEAVTHRIKLRAES